MKCEECRWWCFLEEVEDERSSLKKEYENLMSQVIDGQFDNVTHMLAVGQILHAGKCRRYPPTRLLAAKDEDERYEWYAAFPITCYTDCCGEFTKKE